MCVGNDDDVRSVAHGPDGVFSGAQSGSIVVDHTTASMELAEELDEAAHLSGCTFLDAPLSGGQAGADNAQLTIMVGGDQDTFDRAFPVLGRLREDCQVDGWRWSRAANQDGQSGVHCGQSCRDSRKVCIWPRKQAWTLERLLKSFPMVPRSPGKWTIGPRQWPIVSSNMVSRSIG